jgi:hypothetical protein
LNRHLERIPALARRLGPQQWFLLVFGFLLTLFVVVLLTESTSVGRGGR